MKKNTIAGLALALVLVLGLGFFMMKDSSDSVKTSKAVETTDTKSTLPDKLYSGEYTLSTTITDTKDSASNGTFEIVYKNDKLWKFSSVTTEGATSLIYDDIYTYANSGSGWVQSPSVITTKTKILDEFSFDDKDLAELKAKGVYRGIADCNAGTCYTWEMTEAGAKATDPNQVGTFYITSDGKIDNAKVVIGTTTAVVTFSYKTVNIEIPTDFTTEKATDTDSTE